MQYSKAKNQKGFSMMELLVVMVVLLIILSAVFRLMRATILTADANYQMTDANQNLRNAHEFLTRDLLNAGDGVKDTVNTWLSTAFVTKYLTTRSSEIVDPSGYTRVPIGIIVSDDNLPANIKVPDSSSPIYLKERTDRITMMEIDSMFSPIDIPAGSTDYGMGRVTVPGGVGNFKVGEIYYLTGGGTASLRTITSINVGANEIYFQTGDMYSLNETSKIGAFVQMTEHNTQAIVIKRVKVIQYFVDSNDRLIRRTFGAKGNGIVDSIIAEHIPNLQFNYLLKPESSDASTVFDKPVSQVSLSQESRIRLVEPSIAAETSNPLQNGEKYQIEGKVQISIRNIQFLEVNDVSNTNTTN